MIKVSIVTVCYNSESTILDCIKSVRSQSYPNIEHIFVDGSSTDYTNNIILQNCRNIDIHISEPDNGIYDAMNKGLKLATGDIIGVLNSDDLYCSDTIIFDIVNAFVKFNVNIVFGDLDFVSSHDVNKIIRRWKGSAFVSGSFKKGWHPSHPTFFARKELFVKYGDFDTSLSVSADFELMLRFLERFQEPSYYLDKTVVRMRYGGESTKNLSNILKGNKNILKAFKKNGIKVSYFYPFYRLFPKFKQFFFNG